MSIPAPHFTRLVSEDWEAKVLIYNTDNTPAVDFFTMTQSDSGTWRNRYRKLYGKFYTFAVTVDGKQLASSRHLKGRRDNGHRAAMVDLDAPTPKAGATTVVPAIDNITDAVLYEMHHRDFNVSHRALCTKGKFIALTEPGTGRSGS